MGIVSAVLTLPVLPLRGLLWLAEHIDEQVRAEYDPVAVIRRQLKQAERSLAAGEISEDECEDIQDALLTRLLELTGGPGSEVPTP